MKAKFFSLEKETSEERKTHKSRKICGGQVEMSVPHFSQKSERVCSKCQSVLFFFFKKRQFWFFLAVTQFNCNITLLQNTFEA